MTKQMKVPLLDKNPEGTPGFKLNSKQTSNSLLSLMLRGGVVLSATVIATGLGLFLVTGQSGYAFDQASGHSYITFQETSSNQVYFPTNPVAIWQGVIELKPFAIIMLGLLLLIATPVLNVGLAAFGFLRQRDRAFSLISLFVLAVLAFSFFLGKAGG